MVCVDIYFCVGPEILKTLLPSFFNSQLYVPLAYRNIDTTCNNNANPHPSIAIWKVAEGEVANKAGCDYF